MMKRFKLLALPAALLVAGLATSAQAGGRIDPPVEPPPSDSRNCPDPYPVCGEDGKTYENICEAAREGVPVAHKGACDCTCPAVWDPVCGENGETYGNSCEAGCAGVPVDHAGECRVVIGPFASIEPAPVGSTCSGTTLPRDPCYCNEVIDPVCGGDGNTYNNACEAGCAGVCVAYEGECIDNCNCPAVVDPVCGADGRTYGNSCHAACAGVEVKFKGHCDFDSAN